MRPPMKSIFRRFWPPPAVVVALTYLVVMFMAGGLPESRQLIEIEAAGVLDQAPDSITRVTLSAGTRSAVFVRRGNGWAKDGAATAMQAAAAKTLSRAVKFMRTANPVRVFTPEEIADTDPAEYGLDRPRFSIALATLDGVVLEAEFGNIGNDGILQYMRVANRGELFMMSGFVGKEWTAVINTITE